MPVAWWLGAAALAAEGWSIEPTNIRWSDEGGALVASCDSCAAQICDADPYCCNTAWDGVCVSEVNSVCGLSCDPGNSPAPPPSDPCNGLTYEGMCQGAVLSWCENEQVKSIDCGSYGKTCAWDQGSSYYNCL